MALRCYVGMPNALPCCMLSPEFYSGHGLVPIGRLGEYSRRLKSQKNSSSNEII